MPFIEIKVFEGELSEDEKKKIIEDVTDLMVFGLGRKPSQCYLGRYPGSKEWKLGNRRKSSRTEGCKGFAGWYCRKIKGVLRGALNKASPSFTSVFFKEAFKFIFLVLWRFTSASFSQAIIAFFRISGSAIVKSSAFSSWMPLKTGISPLKKVSSTEAKCISGKIMP